MKPKKKWRIHNPVQILLGRGSRYALLEAIKNKDVLIVCSKRGRNEILNDPLLESLSVSKSITWLDEVKSNPTIEQLDLMLSASKQKVFDIVMGYGGGSALDASKVIALTQSATEKNLKIDEIVISNEGIPLQREAKVIAIPTTFGTGSEVTPFATVWDQKEKKKYSIAGHVMFPDLAIIDSELGMSMPKEVLISTALDAFNQALESIWNINCTPYTYSIATDSVRNFLEIYKELIDGPDINDLEKLSIASCYAGLAISHTRTAFCHSISYPLTSIYGIPHGLACALTTLPVYRLNKEKHTTWFDRLENEIQSDNLENDLTSVMNTFQVVERVNKYFSTPEDLFSIRDRMITDARAGNNLSGSSEEILDRIIEETVYALQHGFKLIE